jgi:outer membrane biosynthesis protein TonB
MADSRQSDGTRVIGKLRFELHRAFDVLERKNRPLHKLLADQIEDDAAGSLQKLARFLPAEVNVSAGSELSLALAAVAQRIGENKREMRAVSSEKTANDTLEHVDDAEIIEEKPSEPAPEIQQARKVAEKIRLSPKPEPKRKPEPEPEPEPAREIRSRRGRKSKVELMKEEAARQQSKEE